MDNRTIITIIGAIVVALFNVIFFLFRPQTLHSAGWISYIFMDIALIVVACIPWIEERYSLPNLNVTTIAIAICYGCISVVAGIVTIAVNPEDWRLAFVIQILILALFFGFTIVNISINKKTANSRE